MSIKLSILCLLLGASCASATGSDPDAARADGRIRADAGTTDAGGSDGGMVDSGTLVPDAEPGPASLLITEIVDGTLTDGLPKFVELTNIGGMPAELSGYSVGVYSNGSATLQGGASLVLSGSLAAGESYVINFDNADTIGSSTFLTVYGVDPDHLDFAALINGNDVVTLFLADGGGSGGGATGTGADATAVDRYGVVGAGGSPGGGVGEVWEYTDGYATRKQSSTGPAAVFDPAQWDFSGADALDGLDASGIAALTSPGSH